MGKLDHCNGVGNNFECFHDVPIHYVFYCNYFRPHRRYLSYTTSADDCNQTRLGIFHAHEGDHLLGSCQTLSFRIISCLPLVYTMSKFCKGLAGDPPRMPKEVPMSTVGVTILASSSPTTTVKINTML